MDKIVVVYHAFLVNNWKELTIEQLERLKKSGLYDRADEIWMTINVGESNEDEIVDFFKGYSKLNLDIHKENGAEYPGIKKVKELCEKYETKVFYFHTKGVSNKWEKFDERTISHEKITNVKYWRECLEYFLIDNWEDCIKKLDEYDNVGVTCNHNWYWGNFWWSNSNHIRKTDEVGYWGRWDYEAWLNKNTPNSKNFEYFHLDYNLFITPLYKDFYIDKFEKYKNQKIKILKATYGTASFEIDEGYISMPLGIVKDVTDITKNLLSKYDDKRLFFNINNDTMNGEPIAGQRKFLFIEFSPENDNEKIIKLGISEGQNIDFQF